MNEFVVNETKLTPAQVVMGTMGVSLNDLIDAIRENRGGQFNHLYKKQPTSGAGQAACPASGAKEETLHAVL